MAIIIKDLILDGTDLKQGFEEAGYYSFPYEVCDALFNYLNMQSLPYIEFNPDDWAILIRPITYESEEDYKDACLAMTEEAKEAKEAKEAYQLYQDDDTATIWFLD